MVKIKTEEVMDKQDMFQSRFVMLHARVLEAYINFALMYMADHQLK